MGCNCKTVRTISTINELYGDNGKENKNMDFFTIILKILILILMLPIYFIMTICIIFAKPFIKKPIDIGKIINHDGIVPSDKSHYIL